MSERQGPNGTQNSGQGQGPRRGFLSRNPFVIILLILGVVLVVSYFGSAGAPELTYDVFKGYLRQMPEVNRGIYPPPREAKDVVKDEKFTIVELKDTENPGFTDIVIQRNRIIGKLRPWPKMEEDGNNHLPKDWNKRLFTTGEYEGMLPFVVERQDKDDSLGQLLESRGVRFKYEEPTDWASMWLWILPLIFFIFIMMMMFRSSRMSGENVLSFGRSRAKVVGEDKTGVTFKDVAGADEAKEELEEIVEFLREPERFTALGGKIPKGCLLMGPPGCGKTLLARAVAGEAAVPFFSISGSDFVEMFVGVGAARVRDLFNTAKQKSPCIIFVDEIDAVGRHRGTGVGGGHDEREQTLNQLLVEMDGFDGRKSVIVIAATNRPDILDPALLRPGRFDRQVVLDAPDFRGREAILKIHSRDKPLSDDVELGNIARRTPGFSGADLANVMNEAALLSARRNRKDISNKEVEEAVERVVAGPERKSRIINEKEKRILAYHELGHALVARFSEGADPVHKVSIIPRGKGALGYTLTLPNEDRYIITKKELLSRLRVTLGGRSAEEVIFNHKSTGAEDDLQKASQLARSLVCRWGMTDELGLVSYARSNGSPFLGKEMNSQGEAEYSDDTANAIDGAVRKIVDTAHTEALDLLTTNRKLLERLADHLIEHEVLNLKEFEAAVQQFAETPPPPLAVALEDMNRETPPATPPSNPPPPEGHAPPSEPPPLGSGPLPQGA